MFFSSTNSLGACSLPLLPHSHFLPNDMIIFINLVMDLLQGISKSKKSSPLILSVLNPPPKSHLREVSSPSSEYSLFLNTHKRVFLAAYKTNIQKSKLLANLQIYQWRHQTEFPIVKTAFVEVKENESSQTPTVQITAYTEYCPLKLTFIYEMPLGQTLYLLKQTMLGFQRLYNRFGCFQIMNSMITISQKGFCRVWLNQNFALNSFVKKDVTESKMVNKIITIIQSHSQLTKATKKLFSFLKNCTTFLNALRAIELFVKQSKIFVPTKFISTSSPSKESSRVEPPTLVKKNLFESDGSALISRLSIKDEKLGKYKDIAKQDFRSNYKERKNSSSPIQFKRLKSEQNIQDFQSVMNKIMKISDLETAHTRVRNRTPNDYLNGSLSRQISNKYTEDMEKSKKKRPGWIEESSYIMCEDQLSDKQSEKKRKELTQSEAFIVGPLNSASSRKYSCKISPEKKNKSPTKNNTMFSKKKDDNYLTQFEHILKEPQREPRKKIMEEDEEKFREEVSGSVLKNNGWVAKVSGLLDMPANLEQSFHEGHQQNLVSKQIKLEKLGNVGRQQMLMSILHQQIEDLL